MLKRTLVLLSFVALAACGPSPTPPDQSTAAAPPAGAAPAAAVAPPPAAVPAPEAAAPAAPAAVAAPAAPSAADQELAKVKAEERRLHREQNALAAQQAAMAAPPPPPPCMDCGVIASIVPVTQQGQAGAAGTLGGAAAGGLLGNQFGHGKGKTAMTVVGVLGGALAGRAVEQQVTSTTVFQVAVNMDAGGQRMVTLNSADGIAPGTRVHVDGNNLLPY